MKYRIKETIDGNGDSTFRVQEKILWWWVNETSAATGGERKDNE